MTNANKINFKQKQALAEFMSVHPDLAKSKLPNCAQARGTSNRLWNQFTTKLNAAGPPVKIPTMWRKVYSDQKHQVKKKLSFNKASKKKTGGGPYEEKILTSAEEQILEAAGLSAAVEGLQSVECFGSSKSENLMVENILLQLGSDDEGREMDDTGMEDKEMEGKEKDGKDKENVDYTPETTVRRRKKPVTKISLLQDNIEKGNEWRSEVREHLKTLVDLKQKSLKIKEDDHLLKQKVYRIKKEMQVIRQKEIKMKEENHAGNMAIQKLDLQIRTIELDNLQKRTK